MTARSNSNQFVEKKFRVLNIALYPTEAQRPENYITLFNNLVEYGVCTIRESKRDLPLAGRIISFSLQGRGNDMEVYTGKFQYGKWLNNSTLAVDLESEREERIPIGGKGFLLQISTFTFYFVPEKHKILVPYSSDQEVRTYIQFLKEVTKQVRFPGFDATVKVFAESEETSLQPIFSARVVKKVKIEISYSNNSNNSGAEEFMDNLLRDGHMEKTTISSETKDKEGLKIKDNNLLEGAMMLSQQYGYTKATIEDEEGKERMVNTQSTPKEIFFTFEDDREPTPEEITDKINELQ